jgi:hypothetical protein
MRLRAMWRALFAFSLCALALTGAAAADSEDTRGIDPNQSRSLVEVDLPDLPFAAAATVVIQAEATAEGLVDDMLAMVGFAGVVISVSVLLFEFIWEE